jgi:hypothetical protein
MMSESSSAEYSEGKKDNIDYTLCYLYNNNKGICGPYIRDRTSKYGLVKVVDLVVDTEKHLRLFGKL